MFFSSFINPIFKNCVSTFMGGQGASLMLTRNLMKTHKGAAKRWRKTADSFKRGKAGRSHGNAGWSRRSLKALSGKTLAHETHIKHLKRLMPN
ncbi:hypothetical protein HG536_0D03130 [Torulaspora globosa]|uniref:50S ribosomal protein L35 n=1 Tax=Torulaspora globosa TaxID=48254 RepID=A0A7G3ZH05_9SACH|nr:uncharacterized protein HG536_0D03130 [Torulaspora globosa]QLL32791.1 hypothetical protein HG536_0D03130 [Torulaspora globosa]